MEKGRKSVSECRSQFSNVRYVCCRRKTSFLSMLRYRHRHHHSSVAYHIILSTMHSKRQSARATELRFCSMMGNICGCLCDIGNWLCQWQRAVARTVAVASVRMVSVRRVFRWSRFVAACTIRQNQRIFVHTFPLRIVLSLFGFFTTFNTDTTETNENTPHSDTPHSCSISVSSLTYTTCVSNHSNAVSNATSCSNQQFCY